MILFTIVFLVAVDCCVDVVVAVEAVVEGLVVVADGLAEEDDDANVVGAV